jgi:Filamin/ABP280 repeat
LNHNYHGECFTQTLFCVLVAFIKRQFTLFVGVTVNKEVPFEISTAGAGKARAEVTISSPSGQSVPCAVVEKPEGFNASFTPVETGPHVVQVTFDQKPVPNSPFKVEATPVSTHAYLKISSKRVVKTHKAKRFVL